jgi:hypothetical protein
MMVVKEDIITLIKLQVASTLAQMDTMQMFFQDFANIVPEVVLLVMVLHIPNVIPVALTH